MKIILDVPVLLAGNYDALVAWYVSAFAAEIGETVDADYHYTELQSGGQGLLGIAKANEMGASPPSPRNNGAVPQFCVSDVAALLKHAQENGGAVLFGPETDEAEGYQYGGFSDPEGNTIWVLDKGIDATPAT